MDIPNVRSQCAGMMHTHLCAQEAKQRHASTHAEASQLPVAHLSPSWLLSADGYTLNDGSCACHKQWGWFTNACEGSFCFDYIGEAQQEGPAVRGQL